MRRALEVLMIVRAGSEDVRLLELAVLLAQDAGDLAERAVGVSRGDEALHQVAAVLAGGAHAVQGSSGSSAVPALA